MIVKRLFWVILGVCALTFLTNCEDGKYGPGGGALTGINYGQPDTVFTVHDASELIGGPAEQGRVGDVLLSNNRIRVIIQKPGKSAGIGSFGGTIIDADRVRRGPGNDQWGDLFPMVNIEWTVNYYTYTVLNDGKDGNAKVLRAYGMIDVYDFLDLDWIADAAAAAIGQQVSFSDRFDDRRDPFNLNSSVSGLSWQVTTDYILKPGVNYVEIHTVFQNPSAEPVNMPVGDFIVGSGELQQLIPGQGFSPGAVSQVGQNTPAVLYTAFPGGDVSYGYFYDLSNVIVKDEETGEEKLLKTSSVSYSGMTGVLIGEEFLKILPVGSNTAPDVHFTIPPGGSTTLISYFVIGDGSAGSLMDTGLSILKIPTGVVSGKVILPDGAPVQNAVVALKKPAGGTIVSFRTNVLGEFSGKVSTGQGIKARAFGTGKYEVWVEKEGYHANGTVRAGECSPSQADVTNGGSVYVTCTLGEAGKVELVGGVTDGETGLKTPARLTIVGEDPSPETRGAGTFGDISTFARPFGIVDVKLVNAKGGFGLTTKTTFDLEPGTYRFIFSHGPEYSTYEQVISVEGGKTTAIENAAVQRIVRTPGFVSADFHIHALPSPDSFFSVDRRALAAVADGLDVLQSSDHDFLTDYWPVIKKMEAEGWIPSNSIQTVVGDEITPNHYGHLHAFPLIPDFEKPDHGALDWSAHPLDEISPAPDYVMSPPEIVNALLKDPGEEVIQINHISDGPTGLPVACGWLTTPIYQEKFGIPAFVAYSDPVERRLPAISGKAPMPPYGMDQNELILDTFSAVELAVGPKMRNNDLWESAMPTWFNLLNLGLMPTATGDSDSHHEISVPLGMPRNYVAINVDPRDGLGVHYSSLDEELYAGNINKRKVVVSAGPYISLTATNEAGQSAGVGDIISGKAITLNINVEAPDWAWFDTIEIYANTEPLPAEDTARFPLEDEAASPDTFAAPYHMPRYVYEPNEKFKLADGTLKDWKEENGTISAHVQLTVNVAEDTWVVVVAKGTRETKGYRSLFPIVPDALVDADKHPRDFDPARLEDFHKDETVGAFAWGFTNPIFIDTDGDTDGNGFPFEAKWVREGFSNLVPFVQ